MGAKTGLVAYLDGSGDGDVPGLLKGAGEPDRERTAALVRRLHPGWEVEEIEGSTLSEQVRPPEGLVYAGSWPGLDVVCDRRVMVDNPTRELPAEVVAEGAGRRMVLHAMHSVVDWLAFAVWQDGQVVRALSLSPDDGIIENTGAPFPFEHPYWAGERSVEESLWPDDDEEPYPLPFHPLELGEDALRGLFGFIVEGRPEPGDVNPGEVRLRGFRVRDPQAPDPAEAETALRARVAAMPPPRVYVMGPDGKLVERPR
ncbi:DUF6928 family protein [Kitasatospora sp. NPDC051853]|uniref:DUF6928 family protein n=1 Tax=Kitasatospora sp. NPDC051853 TaxID=3364058 RepID=UPI003790B17A